MTVRGWALFIVFIVLTLMATGCKDCITDSECENDNSKVIAIDCADSTGVIPCQS